MPLFITHKNIGETPLEALERVRTEKNIGSDVSMTYAGRLDPAAEGVLIILSGDDVHRKEDFSNMPKTYIVQFIFGLQTDTDDLLGILEKLDTISTLPDIEPALAKLTGARAQNFHPYSSKPVGGIPLWQHTRENTDIELPSHEISIQNIIIQKEGNISTREIKERVENIVSRVTQDFRQEKILASWENQNLDLTLPFIEVQIECSSGTYIRTLARELSKIIDTPVVVGSLVRTRVGEFVTK